MTEKNTITPGMTAAVVGFGLAGRAMVRYLSGRGARVLVSDARQESALAESERAVLSSCVAELECGRHSADFLSRADLLVLSPGVNPAHPAIAAVQRTGVEVIGELAIAAPLLRRPVIAITGTNGKTTVTELIGALLAATGRSVFVGGNLGTPIGSLLLDETDYDVVVLEVSSFQLELSGAFVPQVGVLLNITPDHLDRHGSLARYAAAKMRLLQGGPKRTEAVINGEDPQLITALPPQWHGSAVRFGTHPDAAASVDGERLWIADAGGGTVYDLSGAALNTVSGRLNSAAALLAVKRFEIDPTLAQQVLVSFQVGAHRMQVVDDIDGIRFINDSKATNTGAVSSGLSQAGGRVVLIAGGKDKGDDYRLLRETVRERVTNLVLIGEAAPQLAAALGDLVPVHYAASMDDAVSRAAELASPGDTVLLSPACASFDMFDNYQQRGDCFVAAVRRRRQADQRQAVAS
ncbi:UDP-N-acetylmuramoyl-L-alanine--D-glutamate ligase [Desulfofustis glycolicus]|uniref:UDP-N-acetylmuramoylalanine--D-glutamate ligase n=1 Tax=Desulfofustis glycolicus DSM 9705 TaxID=1121409 RepID=A0A1M5XWK1_9BACT|nr:UDP-N-acetylmuramoyl-L-alanine--D-glutamate ligase [Desulfofustis glycolicus]MCB2215497.1 UDP-N-acetylmuramoyl-L-alanine--D-glutamate ligase [Desulfobulbaceae bacterium]SHI04207.1 UDP-N-acetylmuramoylalanine--D-glutamate ligase [Desulfofustis glycolicus DSM 9705]